MWYSSFYNDYLDHQYLCLAIQYFLLARFGSQFPFNPASGGLYHLCFELLIKSYLVKNGFSATVLKDEYGHKLFLLWKEFKNLVKHEDLNNYDLIIINLDNWERVRYISLEGEKNASEIAIIKGHAGDDYLNEVKATDFHSQHRFLLHTDDMDKLFFFFFSELNIPAEELLKVPDFVWGRKIYETRNKYNIVSGL